MNKVSVILPVYNVAKYLPKCIKSLKEQTYTNVEYVFIDDGSPDNSAQIIAEVVAQDNRFQYFKKENGGAASARNFGLTKISGDFVMFLDPDDWMEDDAIEALMGPVLQYQDIGVVVSKYRRVYEGKQSLGEKFYKFQRNFSTKPEGDTVFENKSILCNMYQAPWGKVYRRSIFDDPNVRFPENSYYDDLIFTTTHLPSFGKIVLIDKITMNYLVRPGSYMTTNDERLFEMLHLLQGVVQSYKDRGIFDVFHDELEFFYIQHIIFGLSYRLKVSTVENKYSGYERILNDVKKEFPNAIQNKYLLKESIVLRQYCQLFMKQSMIMKPIFR